MKITRLVLTICAGVVVALVLPSDAVSQEGSAGFVVEVRGTVFLKQNANARSVRLDPKSDVARRLYPREQVRSARGGILRLRLGGKTKQINGPSAWFIISRTASSQVDPIQKALDEYGRLGGRERGKRLQVFSPSDHSVVMPEQFIIRWIPSAAKCSLSLAIKEIEGRELWRETDIDGSSGSLDSGAARQALTKYRTEVGQGPLLLKSADSCGNETPVTFSLLSVKGEASIKQELAFWDKETEGLMLHLGRAYVFNQARMFTQAAEEYEAALMAAPGSRDLLIRTILAHRSTGNFAREEELAKRLPQSTTIP